MKKLLALFFASAALLVGQVAIPAGTSLNITSSASTPSGGTPAYGPGSSTDYALAAWNGTGGNLLRNTTLLTDANANIYMPTTATAGLQIYNVGNQSATNYERLETLWSGNTAIIRTTAGGTGITRVLRLSTGVNVTNLVLNAGGAQSIFGSVLQNATTGNMIQFDNAFGQASGTSGQQTFFYIAPTYNQASGNASNTDLLINRTQTAVGSGAQLLIDAQVSTVSKWKVSNTGTVTQIGPIITTPSALTYASPTSVDVTLASCYTVTTVNATGSVTFNATAGGTAGQDMTILITNDATSAKTITFGTNFLSTGTLTASGVSRHTSITFKSDGTSWYETGRAVLTN